MNYQAPNLIETFDVFNIATRFNFSGEAFADLLFFVVSGFTAIVSLILIFHWNKYSLGGFKLAVAEVVYLLGCASLMLGAFGALQMVG